MQRLKRFLKWGCLGTLLLAGVVVFVTWRQIRAVRENLAVAEPLPVAPVRRDPARVRQLAERAEEASSERVLRLHDAELTYIAQRALKHPEVRALLEEGRQRALDALAEVPDPMGFLQGLRLRSVDLDHVLVDAHVAESVLRLRFTAPYLDGAQHLNVQIGVSGGWAPGAVRVDVHDLVVGSLDVLGVAFYGRLIHDQVDHGVARAMRADARGPLEDVRTQGDALVIRLAPHGAQALSQLAREYLR
ncbi:MAG: hypothetical protein R3F60_07075 [bacterium]